MALTKLLIALVLAGFVPWVTASASAIDPAVVADPIEVAVEVGTIFTVNYWIEPGMDASGNVVCPTDAAHPIQLNIMTTFTLGAFPQNFLVTACNVPYPVAISASAVGVATIVVTASGGIANFYSTVRATGVAYVHSHDDADPPQITVPTTAQEAEATSPLGAQVYVAVGASDNQTTPPQVSCSPNGPWYPLGLTRVNCTAVDSNGNLGRAHYFVHVYDTTPPAIASPGDMTFWPTGAPIVTYALPTWDVVWERTAVVCDPPSGSVFPAGTTTVRCTSTDGSGNTGYANFNVTIIDLVRPKVIASNLVVEATGPDGAHVTLNATPIDFIDPFPVMTCTPPDGSLFPLGATSVTCTATDGSGNSASKTFTVTVVDTTPPAISVPSTLTVEAEGPQGATVVWLSDAVDIVSGARSVTCAPPSGSVFPPGTTRVNCTSVDTFGNRAWREIDVVVLDLVGPALVLPPDATLEATSPAGAPHAYTVTASDDSGPVTPVCAPAPGTFPLGVTTVTCTAMDGSGNVATGRFTVTVVDTTPPALAVPADIFATTTDATATIAYAWGATDIVDADPVTACAPPPGAFPLGDTLVTCRSRDFSGNVATATFTVRVVAFAPPTIAVPPPATLEATGPAGAAHTFAASAWDPNTGSSIPATCGPASGFTFALGTTAITCTATNAWGQISDAFTVTVVDTTPPALVIPTGVAIAAPTAEGATATWPASAHDIVSLATPVLCSPPSGSTFAVGTTTVVCTSSDAAGNVATASFPVVVSPPPPPCSVDGWRPPVDTPGHTKTGINSFTLGSTVPLKIVVSCDGVAYAGTPMLYHARVLADGSLAPEAAGTSLSRATTANRFNANGNHWQYDWDTRGLPAGTYRLRVDLGGGAASTLDMLLR